MVSLLAICLSLHFYGIIHVSLDFCIIFKQLQPFEYSCFFDQYFLLISISNWFSASEMHDPSSLGCPIRFCFCFCVAFFWASVIAIVQPHSAIKIITLAAYWFIPIRIYLFVIFCHQNQMIFIKWKFIQFQKCFTGTSKKRRFCA